MSRETDDKGIGGIAPDCSKSELNVALGARRCPIMDRISAKESIKSCIATSAKDWSMDIRDAWIYGIVFGWNDEAMTEVAQRHGWDKDDIARLRGLHDDWISP